MTVPVVQAVNEYVESELADEVKYDNRRPLDESGVSGLHALAAQIYALGYDAGVRVEQERNWGSRRRERETRREE